MEMVNQTERQIFFFNPLLTKSNRTEIQTFSWYLYNLCQQSGRVGGGGEAVNTSFGRCVLPKHTFTEVNFFPTDLLFCCCCFFTLFKHFQFLRRFKMLILTYFNLTQEPVILFSAARTYPLRQSGGVPGEGLIHFVSLNQM